MIAVALTALAIAGLYVPSASAAPDKSLVFVTQPQDSKAGATIRAADFDQVVASEYVQVKLVDANGATITNSNSNVTFTLTPGPGLVTNNSLSVTARPLINGVATFAPTAAGVPTLSIGTPNEPFTTSYRLTPATTGGGPKISGNPSAEFDIFEDGDSCTVECVASIRNGNEDYSVPTVGTLGASQLSDDTLPGFGCAGQKEVFADSVFVHVTTEPTTTDGFEPVKLVSNVTRQDMKKSANNGQAHIQWCVGLKPGDPGLTNGGTYSPLDLNGDTVTDFFVGFAPPCPQANPSLSAPCIVSQTGDGNGGSITTGWLPGGDPPRRT